RRRTDGEELRLLSELTLEVVPVETAVGGVHLHRANDDAALLGEGAPRRDVAMVIELSDNNFVPLTPFPTQPTRQVEGERGHVLAERDLLGRRVEELGEALPRAKQQGVGLLARRVEPVGVGVMMEEVVGDRVDDRARYLGAARP